MKSLLLMIMLFLSLPIWAQGHNDEHEHEEVKSNVGPNKGVLEADEHKGFVLNASALKNFSIKTAKVTGRDSFAVPIGSLIFSEMEKQVFRVRDGFWKAVDVVILRRDSQSATVKSKDLVDGDAVAIQGVGFLKIVEQSVFGPAIESHVH